MERKRRLAMVFAMIGVALGTGHLVQQGAAGNAGPAAASATPTQIVQVSAGPEAAVAPPIAAAATVVPASPVVIADMPKAPVVADPAPIVTADLSPSAAAPAPPVVDLSPAPAGVAGKADPLIVTPPALPNLAPAPVVADACAPSLRLAAAPQAMIGVSLVAPCAPDARVVIGHGGLSITGKTNAQGSLFLSIPALEVDATVSVRFADATETAQSVRVPAMATLRRMGVQWQNGDAFQLHAFENDAGYDEPGHVSAAKPQMPTTGLAGVGGFITLLGEPGVDLPMLAEVYTFPAGIAANADFVIEAAVTDATCGRELLGETIMTLAGNVYIADLTLAMPDCDAVGDILVLKNLLTDLTIAAAN